MKLAIDFGNSNLKFAGENNGAPVMKIVRSLATRDIMDTNYAVETNGKKLCFGVGTPLVKADKTNREYIEETILLAFHEVYGAHDKVAEVDLALGLPLDLYTSSKMADYKDKVNKLTNNILEGTVNGAKVLVKVKSILVCAEGYSAFLNLLPAIDKDNPAILVDIGYGTTDYLGVSVNPNTKKWQIDKNDTINLGMLNVYEAIGKEYLNKQKHVLDTEQIEYRLLAGKKVLTKSGAVDLKEYLSAGYDVTKDIFNRIEKKLPDMSTRNIYLVGGGAQLIDEITGDLVGNKQISNKDTSLYANVLGYLLQIK